MIYCTFQDKQLSQLGFGAMRLPMKDGAIDEAQVERMVAELLILKSTVDHSFFSFAYSA